ncbi:MAG: 4-hydroxythreonine-4-phosphate dehydrogenase PdxA [Myxococcales bacterium]|nr:MAG: 4-hydroxythreonine-4-phosphate dehydrogenase PdxA [Myxococcales bacterium]
MSQLFNTLALCPGSENGVGPELLLSSLLHHNFNANFIWCSDKLSLERAAFRNKSTIEFLSNNKVCLKPGLTLEYLRDYPSALNTSQRAALSLKNAVDLALSKKINAIVTGPVEKADLSSLLDGPWPGQTEYFSHHLSKPGQKAFMAFLGAPFIMSMMSVHSPLKKIPQIINKDAVIKRIFALAHESSIILGKNAKKINIAVLGLNPHAGENGLLGAEEIEHIIPAIKICNEEGYNITGPHAADGFFAYHQRYAPDVVLAMYHDQGLIPYKMLAHNAVNATLGLSVPRTSPAHGTANELVGSGNASFESTSKAIELAIKLADSSRQITSNL